MSTDFNQYPQNYIDFLYFFNVKQDYYECHEVLEELWLEEGRERFYQGLLQVAVSLYHYQNDNINGANKMMETALDKLALYPENHWMGIDLQLLKNECMTYLKQIVIKIPFYPLHIMITDTHLQALVDMRENSFLKEDSGGTSNK